MLYRGGGSPGRDHGSDLMTELRIRLGHPRDAAAVAALWTEAFAGPSGPRTEPYTDGDYRSFAEHGHVLVAERDGALAGVVGLLLPHSRNARVARGDEAELARLATWRATRRSGVARTLMSHCEKTAREDGRIALVLWTRPRQRAAHVLYESLGFERIPDRDFLDSGEPCRAYCLALVPAVHR